MLYRKQTIPQVVAFLGAALLLPSSLMAQGPIPATQSTLDMISWVTTAITQLVTTNVGVFVADGFILAKLIAIYLLMVRGATYTMRAMTMHWPMTPLDDLGLFIGKFLAVLAMLHYYSNPLPGVAFSFHQIFSETARHMAALIDLSILDQLVQRIQAITSGLEKPGFTDIIGIIVYVYTLIEMGIVQAVLFFVTSFGFVAIGLGSLLGPLFIPFYMWPTQAGKFYRWLDYMIVYSFYQVVATAFVYVWTNVIVYFFDHAIHGDYGLAHLLILIVPFLALSVTFVISMFKIPAIAAELFGGMGSTGAQIASSINNAARAAIAGLAS
ncbi:MAG: type IV secretion system protein [Bryobacteraceae bacterium]